MKSCCCQTARKTIDKKDTDIDWLGYNSNLKCFFLYCGLQKIQYMSDVGSGDIQVIVVIQFCYVTQSAQKKKYVHEVIIQNANFSQT